MTAVIKILTIYVINFLVARQVLPPELAESFLGDPDSMLAIEIAVACVLTIAFSFVGQLLRLIPILLDRFAIWIKNKLGVNHDN